MEHSTTTQVGSHSCTERGVLQPRRRLRIDNSSVLINFQLKTLFDIDLF